MRAPLTVLMLTVWVATVALQGCATLGVDSHQASDPSPRQIQASFLSVPLSFEANQGQTDPQVKFLSRGPGYGLFLTPTEAVLALRKAKPTPSEAATDETPSESAVLRMRLVGANPTPKLSGETALQGKVNYFIGNDPTQWRTNVPTYARARYNNVYPGIDLVYYGNQRQLEYDFVVAPGRDPASITMAFEGMERLELDANTGDLVLQTSGGTIRQRKPVIYQEVAGERHEIVGSYVMHKDDQVGFQVVAYDATKPLIIDPILVFSTYLGGSGDDEGRGIAVDGAGQVYVAGEHLFHRFSHAECFPTDLRRRRLRRLCDQADRGWLGPGLFDVPRGERVRRGLGHCRGWRGARLCGGAHLVHPTFLPRGMPSNRPSQAAAPTPL